MARHDERLKLELVQRYLLGSVGTRELAEQHGVGRTTLRSWINRYREHGAQALRKKHSEYSAAFKVGVLRRMEREALSMQQAATVFDIRGGGGVVAKWLRQYHESGPEALKPKPRDRPKKMPIPKPPKALLPPTDEASALDALRKENEYLRAEVAYLKKVQALAREKRQAAPKGRKPSSS
jgi:transposase